MEETDQSKDAIRRRMRALRKALTPEERESAAKDICTRLIHDSAISSAADSPGGGAVAVYLASPDEIDLSDFILAMLDKGVTVVSPRWNGETYELAKLKGLVGTALRAVRGGCGATALPGFEIASVESLRRGPMNILEPAEAEIVSPSEVAAWIVPGLAFTRDGRRLGYGGGWYDRLLASARKGSLKIGVAHEFQVVEDLPHEPHDIRLDRLLVAKSR